MPNIKFYEYFNDKISILLIKLNTFTKYFHYDRIIERLCILFA